MSSIIKVNTYQDANGNALFSSDGSGNVTTSASGLQNTPFFHVKITTETSMSNNTWTKVGYDTVVTDSDSAFSTANNRFTVPTGKGGKYFLTWSWRTASLGDGQRIDTAIYKNGSFENYTLYQDIHAWTSVRTVHQSVIMDLSATDYIEVWGRQNSGSTQNTSSGSDTGTFFQAYKLIGA
jgi:hypothetical protein